MANSSFANPQKTDSPNMNLKELHLSQFKEKQLEDMGVYGFAYLDFDIMLGPKIKFYFKGKRARFIEKLVKNPTIAVELSIVGKYAQEIVTENNERLLIKRIDVKGEDGRAYPNFLILEIKGNRKRLAKTLAQKIIKDGVKSLRKGRLLDNLNAAFT